MSRVVDKILLFHLQLNGTPLIYLLPSSCRVVSWAIEELVEEALERAA